MKKKICYVISNVDKSYFFEAIGECLDKEKYEVSFIFLGSTIPNLYEFYMQRNYEVTFIEFLGKTDFPKAIYKTINFLKSVKPDIVHTHMSEGSTIGLISSFILGIKNRIHTRHHGDECHVYYQHAVYYDKLNNSLSKKIVATTKVVADVLMAKENVLKSKIHLIHYGYDLEKFRPDELRIPEIKTKYKLDKASPVIGVISRFVHWKGVQYIIPAFKKFLVKYPNAKLVLANARGNYTPEILKILDENLLKEQYTLIEFEKEVFTLYKTFDIFIHTPIDALAEAFGQTYIEALYVGVPSVFTLAGISNEIINDKENAIVVPFKDSDAIFYAMNYIMDNPTLSKEMTKRGKQDIIVGFNTSQLAENLDILYSI